METMRDLLLSWLFLVFLEVWSESQNHQEALLDADSRALLGPIQSGSLGQGPEIYECNKLRKCFFLCSIRTENHDCRNHLDSLNLRVTK